MSEANLFDPAKGGAKKSTYSFIQEN
jgi:hypothetical protein